MGTIIRDVFVFIVLGNSMLIITSCSAEATCETLHTCGIVQPSEHGDSSVDATEAESTIDSNVNEPAPAPGLEKRDAAPDTPGRVDDSSVAPEANDESTRQEDVHLDISDALSIPDSTEGHDVFDAQRGDVADASHDDPTCPEASACDDGNSCTTNDTCSNGLCVGTAIVCPPTDACHVAGVCSDGTCSNPIQPNGHGCGTSMVCSEGSCVSCVVGAPCTAANPCHQGQRTCSSGPACMDTGAAINEGSSCGGGFVCHSGVCDAPRWDCGGCTGSAVELSACCDATQHCPDETASCNSYQGQACTPLGGTKEFAFAICFAGGCSTGHCVGAICHCK